MKTYEQAIAYFEKYYVKQKFDEQYDVYYAAKYIMGMNGKRVRPALVLLACDLFGGNLKTALPAALAIELYHNATLVHDDIMDKADTRRGKPTVHKIYGINVAINTGDVMFASANKFVSLTKKKNLTELEKIFNKTVIEVIEGQSLDMEFETKEMVSESEYLKMIKGKTSVLLAAALQMGAWIADASEKQQKQIYDFGLNLGLSFQLQDDFLDAFGDSKKVGKIKGGDILLNKKTLLLIKTLELAKPAQKKGLKSLLTEKNKSKKITEISSLMETTGAKKYTEQKIEDYYKKALSILKKMDVPEERKQHLRDMAAFLNNRNN
ncbi:MAG TPA: polyprenyl synthetase family protein [Chitinophagales bacterium]